MNLENILPQDDLEAPSELHLVHPVSGEDLFHEDEAMIITLLGVESALAKSTMKKRAQRQLNSRAKQNIDETIAFNTSFLAKLITGWSGMYRANTEIVFSREEAVKLLTDFPWIREQVDAFVTERSNFIKS